MFCTYLRYAKLIWHMSNKVRIFCYSSSASISVAFRLSRYLEFFIYDGIPNVCQPLINASIYIINSDPSILNQKIRLHKIVVSIVSLQLAQDIRIAQDHCCAYNQNESNCLILLIQCFSLTICSSAWHACVINLLTTINDATNIQLRIFLQ